MSRTTNLPYNFQWSTTHAHIAWADIQNNGVLIEIAVVALDEKNGDLYFIPIAALDNVDRERLIKIISKRDAHKYPLWDLMSGSTLKNGINALEYFNQLVKVRSVSGQIFTPNSGKMGVAGSLSAKPASMGALPVQNVVQPVAAAQPVAEAVAEQEPARRGPGRPPSAKK